MNIEELFKYSFVISVNEDRFNWYKKVFTHFNLPISEKIGTIIDGQTKEENCGYNHLQCVKLAKERKYPYCLVFEDDAYPRKDIIDYLNNFIQKLNNCSLRNKIDLLHLGYYDLELKDVNGVDFLKKPVNIHGSHAYIIYDRFYKNAIQKITKDKFFLGHIDHLYKKCECYVCKDRIFEQYMPECLSENIMHAKQHAGHFYGEFIKWKDKIAYRFNKENFIRID